MTTYPHRHGLQVHRLHVNSWLIAVVGLTAALIGLSAWVLVDRYAGGSSTTDEATTLIDKFNAASSRGDAAGVAALLTGDAVISSAGDTITGPKAIANGIATSGLNVERIAPVSVNGDYATTFIDFSAAVGFKSRMLSVSLMRDGKIARIWTFVFGQTPPFDNIPVDKLSSG